MGPARLNLMPGLTLPPRAPDAAHVDGRVAHAGSRQISALLAILLLGCTGSSATPDAAGMTDAGAARGPRFTEVGREAGLVARQQSGAPCGDFTVRCAASQMTGGVAVGDVDGDGFDDVYLTRLDAPGLLMRNRGDGTFEDVTAAYGLDALAVASNGAAFADVDRDGDLDLYVTTFAEAPRPPLDRFVLLMREGDRFVDRTEARGAGVVSAADRSGFSVATGDYDRDGWVDLHVTEWEREGRAAPPHTRLLHNAAGDFVDVTREAGASVVNDACWERTGFCDVVAFASAFSDLDGDGWADLLVAADFGHSQLFWNLGDGTFVDGTAAAGVGLEENGMGSTVGDYDGDGDLDWFVTAIGDPDASCGAGSCTWGYSGNRLYRNEGDRTFTDVTDEAGVRVGGWGWGAAFFDHDNDGDLDLVMTNGIDLAIDTQDDRFNDDLMRFWDNVGDGRFVERSAEVGLTDGAPGKGLVVFDYDRDGDQDVLVVVTGGRPLLYRNDGGSDTPSLRVRLVARDSAPEGLGARVEVRVQDGGAAQVREMGSVSHFLGQSERVAHFGLGEGTTRVAEVRVRWPSGRASVLRDVAPGALTVEEPE